MLGDDSIITFSERSGRGYMYLGSYIVSLEGSLSPEPL